MVEHCVARNIIEPTNFFGEKVRISKEISGEWTKIFFDKSLIFELKQNMFFIGRNFLNEQTY